MNKLYPMKTALNILAIAFVLGWLMGVFIFTAGILIHILLILGLFSFSISMLSEEDTA